MRSPARPPLLLAGVILVAFVVYEVFFAHRGAGTPTVSAPSTSASPVASAPPRGPASASPEARRARDAMRAQIVEALRRRDAGAPREATRPAPALPAARAANPAEGAEPERGSYEPAYIQAAVREQIFPLIRGCYEAALEKNPRLAGKLVFSFRLVGDPSIGGVVDDAEFGEGSDIKDPEMETCTRESMMTLTLDKPPTGGGVVSVRYPVDFAPGDDDDDAGADAAR